MHVKPGQRLVSVVCDTEVVVVRAPEGAVEIGCGGAPMVAPGDPVPREEADESIGAAPAVGRRYADEEIGLELLCTKAGVGALTADGVVLGHRVAKPLPSSD